MAALLDGMDKGGFAHSLDTDSPPGGGEPDGPTFQRLVAALEELFGPLQQQQGPGRSLGELELLNMAGACGARGRWVWYAWLIWVHAHVFECRAT